jgi:hypothetical protein
MIRHPQLALWVRPVDGFVYRSFIFNNLCLVNLLPQIGKFFSGERKIIRLKLKNRSAENDLSSSVRA